MEILPVRKPNRIKDYDYSTNGVYFITICTKGRCEVLGVINGSLDDIYGTPSVKLSEYGKTVKGFVENIPNVYSGVDVPLYIIMPDHVHLIIECYCEDAGGTPRAASSHSRLACRYAASPTNMLIPKIVNSLKGLSSKKTGVSLWQRSYSDHVIRNYSDYLRIADYISTNPLRRLLKQAADL